MGEESTKPLKYKPGQNPNSLKNLRAGNPPIDIGKHGYSLTSALKDNLNKPLKVPDLDAPVRDHIVYATLQGALKREPTPLREVWDRSDGKLIDKQALIGDILIEVVYRDKKEVV